MKLNVLLAKTDALAPSFKKGISDFVSFFKTKQGAFQGEKKTYTPKQGMIDIPGERGDKVVTTTVSEKLQWLVDSSKDYINALFSQEATNASGLVKAKLIVEGKEFGEFSSLELLRLKGLLENGELTDMYASIPVRSDAELWKKTSAEQYTGRDIFEGPLSEGTRKSTTKETYILEDPNISQMKDTSKYTPQTAVKDTIIDLGDYTYQKYSGELSQRERAEILRRRTVLLTAVIEALKTSNEAEAIPSGITAQMLFGYLHGTAESK